MSALPTSKALLGEKQTFSWAPFGKAEENMAGGGRLER